MLKQARLDETFRAMADPTRRAILERLSRGEARVTEVARPFPISLNSVSKHIQILERAELVQRRQVGRDHFLRINQPEEGSESYFFSDHAKSARGLRCSARGGIGVCQLFSCSVKV